MTGRRPSPAWLPLVVGAVAACLYILTLQAQLFGDGIFFRAKLMESDGSLIYNHILYLPLAKLLQVAVGVIVTSFGGCSTAACHCVAPTYELPHIPMRPLHHG